MEYLSKILLVDDERDIMNLLEEVLRQEGFQNILKTTTGENAVEICRSKKPDAIILDIMLPGIDGIETCRRIREFSNCPILFLSSKNDDVDKILGLSCGGDDYVTKPFSPKEVAFRIKAQLRRKSYDQKDFQSKAVLKIRDIQIDTDSKANSEIIYCFDETLLKRALNNLIYNALIHNPADTEIHVALQAGNKISITIEDNGNGMSAEEVDKLFQRYYRGTNTEEKAEGTGLGMAIAKQIIEIHDGEIHVESQKNAGTMITITFPVSN